MTSPRTIRQLLRGAGRDLADLRDLRRAEAPLGYIGWVGYGNLGDEAVFRGIQTAFPDNQCLPLRDTVARRTVGRIPALSGRYDGVALGGGTLALQSNAWLTLLEDPNLNDVPKFCLGTGAADPDFWRSYPDVHGMVDIPRWIESLQQFRFVGVRGPLSAARLQSYGVKAEVVGDAALVLAPETASTQIHDKVLGVNVSHGTDNVMHGTWESMIDPVSTALTSLQKDGWKIRIFPMWGDDEPASVDLCRRLDPAGAEIVRKYASPAEFMREVASCQVFIGQKLHATVLAAAMRVPSIMLEYRPKCLDFMSSLGWERFSVRTDAVRPAELVDLVGQLVDKHDYYVGQLDERVLTYRRRLLERAGEITRSLRDAPEAPG